MHDPIDDEGHHKLDSDHEADDFRGAVTTRHLAEAIGYSQPVLYGHFPGGKSEIMLAVAHSYLDFANEHPAIYEAMFRQSIDSRFAEEGECVPSTVTCESRSSAADSRRRQQLPVGPKALAVKFGQ